MQSFAILPAAGRSNRMGSPKLLLPWNGTTVIERVLETWRSTSVSQIVVTVHPEDTVLAEVCRNAGAAVVVPNTPPGDMKTSVRLALGHIAERHRPRATDAWLVAPADMPGLTAAAIEAVLRGYAKAAAPQIVVPTFADRRGHPVLFPWSLAAEVGRLEPDQGINALLIGRPVLNVECRDRSILDDLDTPEDYRRLQSGQD